MNIDVTAVAEIITGGAVGYVTPQILRWLDNHLVGPMANSLLTDTKQRIHTSLPLRYPEQGPQVVNLMHQRQDLVAMTERIEANAQRPIPRLKKAMYSFAGAALAASPIILPALLR